MTILFEVYIGKHVFWIPLNVCYMKRMKYLWII